MEIAGITPFSQFGKLCFRIIKQYLNDKKMTHFLENIENDQKFVEDLWYNHNVGVEVIKEHSSVRNYYTFEVRKILGKSF